jgi:hypothetical protein
MNQRVTIGLAILVLIMSAGTFVAAQSSAQLPRNPEQVLQRERIGALLTFVDYYFQYETQGGRLTNDGWKAADTFFLHPIPPPHQRTIYVIGEYGVGGGPGAVITKDGKTGSTRGTVPADVLAVGKIDPALQFAPDAQYEHGLQLELVLTKGRPAWKFNVEDTAVFVGVPTAILYVSLMRDRTTDGVIRKNADTTIAALKKIPAY